MGKRQADGVQLKLQAQIVVGRIRKPVVRRPPRREVHPAERLEGDRLASLDVDHRLEDDAHEVMVEDVAEQDHLASRLLPLATELGADRGGGRGRHRGLAANRPVDAVQHLIASCALDDVAHHDAMSCSSFSYVPKKLDT